MLRIPFGRLGALALISASLLASLGAPTTARAAARAHPAKAAITSASAISTAATLSASAAGKVAAIEAAPAPGFYRFMLGSFAITALSDGKRPINAHMLSNISEQEVDQTLAGAGQANPVPSSFNAFLIDTGSKLVLIDTGAGALWGPQLGKLGEQLQLAGYAAEQVDEIYLTHMHSDHIGGLMDGDSLRFPHAIVRASKAEADYWLSPARLEQAADKDKGSFRNAQNALRAYIANERFLSFEPGAELAPGIRAVASEGHTAGHSTYLVESAGQKLLVWGDMLHIAAIQFGQPGATMRFDYDGGAAVSVRRQVLQAAARDGLLVAGAHLPFPGIGKVVAREDGFAWQPQLIDQATAANRPAQAK
ncbi:MBL fold metallo-hydrolase [Oxalobacteraceae bacterium]|nr:MBL fold metallo-hydrolase [Oxalobacteraceae bacterium]